MSELTEIGNVEAECVARCLLSISENGANGEITENASALRILREERTPECSERCQNGEIFMTTREPMYSSTVAGDFDGTSHLADVTAESDDGDKFSFKSCVFESIVRLIKRDALSVRRFSRR